MLCRWSFTCRPFTVHGFTGRQRTPDGDGSLLDHSILLYGGGISDGDRHSHDNLPVLLAGGGAGRLRGGRHLRFKPDTPLMNLHLALLDKLGVPLDRLGDGTGQLPMVF